MEFLRLWATNVAARSNHQDVAELPWNVFLEERTGTARPGPSSGVQVGYNWPTTGPRYGRWIAKQRRKSISSASTMPAVGVLQHPDNAGEHGRRHLQPGGVLVGGGRRVSSIESCEPYRSASFRARSSSTPSSSMPPSTMSSSVRICDTLLRICHKPAGHFMQREHRVIAGVIGVMAGRPVHHAAVLTERGVVRDRDELVVGDVVRPCSACAVGVQERTRVPAPGCIK